MNKLPIILVPLVFVVIALSVSVPISSAQTPTATPMPTPTARPDVSPASVIDPGSTIGISTFTTILNWGTSTKTQMDSVNLMLTTSFDDTALRIHAYSPLPYLRGAAILFGEFDWLVKIIGWFLFAAIVIVLVSVVRFIISAWGIIERLLDVIKAIPFV